MHQGFTFELSSFTDWFNSPYAYQESQGLRSELYDLGKETINEQKQYLYDTLDYYLLPDGSLSASDIKEDWFPEVDANVLLSHAHRDKKEVMELAGFLRVYGLKPFVDFSVWGYCDDLLKLINNKYHKLGTDPDGSIIYDHNGANYAASHVSLILESALQEMIDKTECVIFLDTPNSLKMKDGRKAVTGSPWIFSELQTARLITKKALTRKICKSFRYDEAIQHSDLSISYDVDL